MTQILVEIMKQREMTEISKETLNSVMTGIIPAIVVVVFPFLVRFISRT